MALIKSISGIRGTIGGRPGDTLSPLDVVRFTAAFGTWLLQQSDNKKIIIGRDIDAGKHMLSHATANLRRCIRHEKRNATIRSWKKTRQNIADAIENH